MAYPIEDGNQLIPVFCTAEMSAETLDLLLSRTDEAPIEGTMLRVIDTTDLDSITKGHDTANPVAPFKSPFLKQSPQQLQEWMKVNITDKQRRGFSPHTFLVLDDATEPKRSADGDVERTALLCSVEGEETLRSVRCDFSLALTLALDLDLGREMEDGVLGCFYRSGTTVTRAGWDIACKGAIYMEDGEVKKDEEWEKFLEDSGPQ